MTSQPGSGASSRAEYGRPVRAFDSIVRRSVRRAGIVAGLALGGVVSLVVASAWVVRRASPYVYATLDEVPPRTVAIVPGCRVYADGSPSATLEDRLTAALELHDAGKVRKILVSGDHGRRGYDEVGAMHDWLVARGVPDEDVFLDHAGFRTLDTMQRAARIFEVDDAIVCTQEFHLSRSVFLARDAGIDAVGYVADRRVYPARRSNEVRELFARTRAVLDVYVLHTEPELLGDRIPIDAPRS